MLREHETEAALSVLHVYSRARERVLYSPVQCRSIANLNDGLDCRSHVPAIMSKNECSRAELNLPYR